MKTKDNLHAEAMDAIRDIKCCSVNISMGTGKTKFALERMAMLPHNAKVLVVIPIKGLEQNWKDDAEKFNLGYVLEDVDFVIYRNLHKIDPSEYDFVVFDEIHKLKAGHENFVNGCSMILGLTGTPPKKRSDANTIISHYAPFVFDYELDEAIGDGIVNDYKITVHAIPLSTAKTIERINSSTGKSFFVSEDNDYSYRCSTIKTLECDKEDLRRSNAPYSKIKKVDDTLRFRRIARLTAIKGYPGKVEFIQKLIPSIGDRVVIFANTHAQADKLCSYSHHSKNKHSDSNTALFNTGGIGMISCVEQLSIGVNLKNARTGIIMHLYSENSDKGRQRMGRLLRLNTDDTCHLHIICYRNTVDQTWVEGSLSDLDQSKITWINH